MSDSANIPARLDSVLHEVPGLKVTSTAPRRLKVEVEPDRLPALLVLLKGRAGFMHLSAISCVDWPQTQQMELVYHVWSYELNTMMSAHVFIPADPARFISVYDIHTPAGFFERDIHEMFGVHFEGAPNLNKFILTSWDGPPPMKKSFDTRKYAEETFQWRDYQPHWLKDVEESGGGME